MMRLWVIVDNDRWGHSVNIVRASSEEEAIRYVRPNGLYNRERIKVTELKDEPGLLWVEDESPDTPASEWRDD